MTLPFRFMGELAVWAALAVVAVLSSGCMGIADYSSRDRATMAAREYTDGVRWGKYDQAASHVPRERRDHFIEQHAALEDELEIADYELVQVNVDKIDNKHEKVTARVDYTWTLKRVGIVEKTTTEQVWEEKDGKWMLSREERVKGAPLALFDERKSSRAQATP
jgi:hypothetical protein